MTITHILAEFNGTSGFTLKAQQRDGGGSVLDSYTFGDISATKTGILMKAWQETGLFGQTQLLMKISSTEF